MQGERVKGEREKERERGGGGRKREREREGERNRVHVCMYIANKKLMQGENVSPCFV